MTALLSLAVVLGGPSAERGISLNSARSIADHIRGIGVDLGEAIYFSTDRRAYSISRGLLYCNTPQDFDFKLSREGVALSEEALLQRLRAVDLVFPAIHGELGEDGELQALLERAGVPYVGSGPAACARAFDKYDCREALARAGIDAVPGALLTGPDDPLPAAERLVLKPARGGSSIDVFAARDEAHARELARELLARHDRVLAQPMIRGTQWTAAVLAGPDGPVALAPTEVELRHRGEIFTYRDKYLASDDAHFHCPPTFAEARIDEVRALAERVFTALELRDFARIDGWLTDSGELLVSDVNPISGMEQTSFLFVQAAQARMSHADLLRHVIRSAARRHGLAHEPAPVAAAAGERRPLPVLFGGATAERQVSVTSGINVWLKLQGSERYAPTPHLLGLHGEVWSLSYASALRHSVEEALVACERAAQIEPLRARLEDDIHRRLALTAGDASLPRELPRRRSLEDFLDGTDVLFIALHGGMGEDGRLQAMLEQRGIRYNGSGPQASRLCIDKFQTGLAVAALADPAIGTARRVLREIPGVAEVEVAWAAVVRACGSEQIIVKPVGDGCSAGVVPLASAQELAVYLEYLDGRAGRIDGRRFSLLHDEQEIEPPSGEQERLLFEQLIATDDIRAHDATGRPAWLEWARECDTGWVEVTVGVLGHADHMHALNPSITVARDGVLSVEEKFMGGTGVNITPPPQAPDGRIAPGAIDAVKAHIERVANALGLEGYARVDAFMQRDSGEIIVIEVNTLPGLTPATVLFHQGVAETPSLSPREVLERIVDLALAIA
ncbi:MAG TPA: ATP-grasp domain-containing protein [Solirubrobacteraceae bacterium]|jgi:D-alanine--D-alanine ligase|nr:ATP-grasp domain-containing protein [Solirubrobacteraceae bacterium]